MQGLEFRNRLWVFGFERGERRRLMEIEVQKRYGEKAQYFSRPEIGKEMLVCAMYSEELMERLEDMEGL